MGREIRSHRTLCPLVDRADVGGRDPDRARDGRRRPIGCAVLFGDRRSLLRSSRQLFGFDKRDAAWLRNRVRRRPDREGEPAWGMFNTGQKVLAWALGVSVAGVIITGVLAWSAHSEEGGPHGAAVVVTAVLLSAHVFMAVVNPATRPALAGMVFGRVRRSWAAKHHGEWLADRDDQDS